MNRAKWNVIIMVFWLGTFSCSENEVGESARMTIRMLGSNHTVQNARISAGLNVDEAFFGVSKIELERESEHHGGIDDHKGHSDDDDNDDHEYQSNDEFELEIKGNYVVDLINGTSQPEIPTVSLDPGFYNEVKVELSPILEGGYSVILKGSHIDDQGNERAVEFILDQFFEIKIENRNGFNLDVEKLNQILLLFELEAWFADIRFDELIDEDGVIRIKVDVDEDAVNQVKINIGNHCKGGSDDNNDGELDDD
jgi:hypothetical protein